MRRGVHLGSAWVGIMLALQPSDALSQRLRPWTAVESVDMRYCADYDEYTQHINPAPSRCILPSVDGLKFMVLSRYGRVATDENIYELSVFDVETLTAHIAAGGTDRVQPVRRLTMSSVNNVAGISRVEWKDGSAGLFFKGTLPVKAGRPEVYYRFDVGTGALVLLTPQSSTSDAQIRFLDIRGEAALYSDSMIVATSPAEAPDRYPVSTVLPANVTGLARSAESISHRRIRLMISHNGEAQEAGELKTSLGEIKGKISPDGRLAVVLVAPTNPVTPSEWNQYEVPSSSGESVMSRFMLVDMKTGAMKPMLDAPSGTVTKMGERSLVTPDLFWRNDGKHVILVNAALPLAPNSVSNRTTAYVVDVNLEDGSWKIVAPLEEKNRTISAVSWERPGESLDLRYVGVNGAPAPSRKYMMGAVRRVEKATHPSLPTIPWQLPTPMKSYQISSENYSSIEPVRFANGLSVFLRETPNEPQSLVAAVGGHELLLSEPDPALVGVSIAPSQTVEWKEADGQVFRGLLTMPLAPRSNRPPLVIQIYDFMPNVFRPDGPSGGSYAAQALAARGIAVLGVNGSYYDRENIIRTPEEGPAMARTIDLAVAALSERGLIDHDRVGLAGFSRAGFLVSYVLTHPGRVRLSAAVAVDNFTAGYSDYLTLAGLGKIDGRIQYEYMFPKKSSFWQSKSEWLRESPEFNIDRVQAPLLYMGNGTDLFYTSTFVQMLGAFALAGRPLEILNFPLGDHPVVRPRERYESITATVDWMDFWLSGYEDDRSGKTEKYTRWRAKKADWLRVQATEAALEDEKAP